MPGVSPAGLTCTLTDGEIPGLLDPEPGVTESQVGTEPSTLALAVQFIVPCPPLTTSNVCAGTTPPLWTAVKVSPFCDRIMVCGVLLTVTLTGMLAVSTPDRLVSMSAPV